MTTTAHSERPSAHARTGRRGPATTIRETAERAHIVRVIASQPVYTQWLRDKVADVVEVEARRQADLGHHALATVLAERAAGYRAGTLAVW